MASYPFRKRHDLDVAPGHGGEKTASGEIGDKSGTIGGHSPRTLLYDLDGVHSAQSMAPADESRQYAAAWNDRKRRFLIYVVAINSFWLLVLGGILAQANPRFDLPGRTVILAFVLWFVAQVAAGVWLNRFRCPRCGDFFYWKKWSWKIEKTKNKRQCRHCGLIQDSAPA